VEIRVRFHRSAAEIHYTLKQEGEQADWQSQILKSTTRGTKLSCPKAKWEADKVSFVEMLSFTKMTFASLYSGTVASNE